MIVEFVVEYVASSVIDTLWQSPQLRPLREVIEELLSSNQFRAYTKRALENLRSKTDTVLPHLFDIDFIAQYLQLVHAAEKPDILSVDTQQALDNAHRLGVLSLTDVETLRPAARLYHDLTQILRLCVSDRFKPDTVGEDLLRVMARAHSRAAGRRPKVRRRHRQGGRPGSAQAPGTNKGSLPLPTATRPPPNPSRDASVHPRPPKQKHAGA